jgi:hypothetical protein
MHWKKFIGIIPKMDDFVNVWMHTTTTYENDK